MGELSPVLICLLAAAPPSKPEAVGRACPEVLRLGELSLPFISCSIRESGPHILPGQHGRAVPEGVGVEELPLKMRKPGNWPHPLLIASARGELARAMQESHPDGEDRGELVG